jgi:hypothetical protein
MATRFKDFGAPTTTAEPLSFALFEETFHCRPSLQGKFLLDLVAESSSDEPGAAALVMKKFFETVLVEESLERFNALAEDPDRIVSVETLSEITSWLVEEYSARPTQRPEDSPSGQ